MHSVLDAIITSNEQLGQRAEEFAQLLVEHDKTLDELLERIGKTVPEIRKELESKLTEAVPGLVSDAYAKYNEDLEGRCRAALTESQTKLEAVRAEIVGLAQAQFTEAEKQIGLTAEQIESRILGTLTEAAKERITKLERGLVIEIQHAVNAALPKQELAAAPTLIDSYRGQWKEGMVAQRGDLFSWYGSTYLALEDTNDTPGRKNIATAGAKWAVIAARGAGGGGGGGGDSLPSQTGNAGKFLKTDGTSTLWESIPGGGDMLGANNLTDVASVTAAFANIKQAATTTASGVVTFATSGESAALKAVQANDSRLSDSRTPTAHASTHQTGGSDPIDFPVDSVFGATNTITQVDYFALNTSSTASVTTAKAVWNATESSLEIGLNSSVNALLGVDAHVQVYNQSGSPFTKGQVVRQDGSSGTRLKVVLALGTDDTNSATTIGLVSQTIGNNSSGFIITNGLLRGIDTNAFNEGDTLWLSATTPGGLVNTRPTQPNHSVRIGYVIKKAGTADGIIYVDILNGFELEELHDVLVTTVANRDFLSYDSSTTVWRNRQLFDSTAPAALGASATAGVSITAARVDHVHARPTFDQLDIASAAQGDILYRSATSWARLPAATAGYILQTNGAAANPGWVQNTGGSGAPTDAEYIVASANGSLSAERVISNSTSVTVNFATGGQVSLERAALTGDVTASQNSNATTIANDAVSNAKLANMVASTIKARVTASTGDPEDASLTQVLDLVGSTTYGDVLYRGSTSWQRLAPSVSGYVLATQGQGANPLWVAQTGGGGGAPTDAEYLVASANGTLSAERVIQNSTSITVNLATGGQFALERAALTGDVTASQNSNSTTIANGVVSTAKLGGDITTAGKNLLDDADASAQRTTLGLGTLATQSGTFSGTSSGTNTGDQTISLTGDVTGSGTGSFAATIAAGAVSTSKLGGDITTAGKALLDDADASAQRTTLGLGTLATQSGTFSGTSSGTNTGDQTISLTGDVTGSGTGSFAATIANDAVTNAKLANMAASTIKARITGSTGDPEDATFTQVLDLVGSATYGDILYRDSSSWARLPAGTSGNYLKTQGAGAAPTWATVSASGGGSTNLWLAASQWIPRTTTGAGIDSRELTTNNYDELLFDAGTAEFAQALAVMPSNYNNGTLTARFYWTGSGALDTTDDVVWGFQGVAVANDDALGVSMGTAVTVADTVITINDMMISSATTFATMGGTPAANKPLLLQVYRDAANAGDTYGHDARLLGVEISYTAS